MKSKILADCTGSLDLLERELEDENLLFPTKIHIGFAADEISKLF